MLLKSFLILKTLFSFDVNCVKNAPLGALVYIEFAEIMQVNSNYYFIKPMHILKPQSYAHIRRTLASLLDALCFFSDLLISEDQGSKMTELLLVHLMDCC